MTGLRTLPSNDPIGFGALAGWHSLPIRLAVIQSLHHADARHHGRSVVLDDQAFQEVAADADYDRSSAK